jgi:hypothetical protein
MTGSVTITGSLAVVTNGTEFQVTNTGVRIGNVIGDTHTITGSIGISGSLTGTIANFVGAITSDMTDGGIIFTKTAGNSTGLFTNTFQISGSGTKNDLNAYVYGGESFGVWTNAIKRLTINGAGAATFSGSVTNSGLIFNTNDAIFNTAGSITKHATVGLVLRGVTASVFDFAIYSANGTALMTNSTGTNNINFNSGQVWFNGGNVGINTTTTDQKLVINQGATGTGQGVPATTGTTQNGMLRLRPAIGVYGETLDFGMNVSTTYGWIQATNASGLGTNYPIAINPNGGNVGIGTTDVQGLLDVFKSNSGGLGGYITLRNNGAAVANETAVMFVDGGMDSVRAAISCTTEGAPYLGDIKFKTGASAYASLTTRMMITGGGNVLIGKTSDAVSAETVKGIQITQTARILCTVDGTYSAFSRLTSDGDIITFHRGQVSKVGSISVTTTATAFNTGPSDLRLKKNIVEWNENVLNLFKDINPKLFHFNTQEDTEIKSKGFIAQEMSNKFPEAYPLLNQQDGEERYMFNPSGMTVYLMKAIQELEARVQELENK